jgi:hypothetical protein
VQWLAGFDACLSLSDGRDIPYFPEIGTGMVPRSLAGFEG